MQFRRTHGRLSSNSSPAFTVASDVILQLHTPQGNFLAYICAVVGGSCRWCAAENKHYAERLETLMSRLHRNTNKFVDN